MAEAKIPKAADASKHKAGGGNVEICQPASSAHTQLLTVSSLDTDVAVIDCSVRSVDRKLDWKAEAKIPKATDASKHKAGGGNVEICQPSRLLHSATRASTSVCTTTACSHLYSFRIACHTQSTRR